MNVRIDVRDELGLYICCAEAEESVFVCIRLRGIVGTRFGNRSY